MLGHENGDEYTGQSAMAFPKNDPIVWDESDRL